MKICLLGEKSVVLDEAMKKVSYYTSKELSKNNDVLLLDLKDYLQEAFWKSIGRFRPDIIHYLHGPSFNSFVLMKLASIYCRRSKTIMSAVHPDISFLSSKLTTLLKPDLLLVQALESERLFQQLGFNTMFFPCGVDIAKFIPVSDSRKIELRRKYHISEDRFVIFHVGSIKVGRNLGLLSRFARAGNIVLVAGAMSQGVDLELGRQLKESGCVFLTRYLEHIEEVFALSDCYVFPVVYKRGPSGKLLHNSIEMPLSVLEAMSCNVPVVTTHFGGLPRVFDEGDGLFYADDDETIVSAVERIRKGTVVNTRIKVSSYSWDKIARNLERIYSDMLSEA